MSTGRVVSRGSVPDDSESRSKEKTMRGGEEGQMGEGAEAARRESSDSMSRKWGFCVWDRGERRRSHLQVQVQGIW